MRDDGATFTKERDDLAAELPELFRHFARITCAAPGAAARAHAREAPEVDPGPNFGTLSQAGYARAFYDGMEEDVVPGLVAIGLPEAEAAYAALVAGDA
jgi:hypothetical protein